MMTVFKILAFIRFRILYISSKYRRLEHKFISPPVSSPFENLVGMADNAIRNFVFNYGRNEYDGGGALIDLGSWLGATVIPLAEGLKENQKAINRKIHVFDAFVWYENMNQSIRSHKIDTSFNLGESFRKEFDKQTMAYKDMLIVHEGNILHTQWPGESISYMMIDAMKDWELAKKIVFTFYPCLIPEKAIVIHEDFCHHYTSWIHLIQFRLRNFFEPLTALENSSGVAFKCIKPIQNISEYIPDRFLDFLPEEIEAAFDYSLSLVHDSNKNSVLASKIMAYRHRKDYSAAKRIIKNLSWRQRWLNLEIWQAIKCIQKESPKNYSN